MSAPRYLLISADILDYDIPGFVIVIAMPQGASSLGSQNECGVAAAIIGSSTRQMLVVFVYSATGYVRHSLALMRPREEHVPVPVKSPGCTHWLHASAKETAKARDVSCEHRILKNVFSDECVDSVILAALITTHEPVLYTFLSWRCHYVNTSSRTSLRACRDPQLQQCG